MDYELLAVSIAEWLESYRIRASANGYAVGISGGVDSAVAAKLAVMGCGPEKICGVRMPGSTMEVVLACKTLEWLGCDYDYFPIEDTLRSFKVSCRYTLSAKELGNVVARLRMTALYAIANHRNYLVLGTGNQTELSLGYFTKYGDGGVDILPLGDLYKTEVWELARVLGVLQEVIDATPTAGLWEGQTDEGEIGYSYEEIDRSLESITHYVATGPYPVAIDNDLWKMNKTSFHKRRMPPIYSVPRVVVGADSKVRYPGKKEE